MATRLLLVEDDLDLRETLESYLTEGGFEVRVLGDAEGLPVELARFDPHVVVLDINLPGESGFEAAQHVRARPRTGLIMLTGRSMRDDRLQGLAAGADHYLVKPADPAELEMVIRNLHRRLEQDAPAESKEEAGPDAWCLDLTRWCLIAPNSMQMPLTSAERHLVHRLMQTPGQPVPRLDLVPPRNRMDPDSDGRGLDVMVFRLRRKVERECGCALPLLSARGIGYVFAGQARFEGTES